VGRKLHIAGNISIDLSLEPTVKLNEVSLANSAWAQQPTMLDFKTITLSFDALALLKGVLDVKHINLENGGINLESKNNKNNWDFATADTTAEKNQNSQDSTNQLNIKKINLKNIRVKYQKQVLNLSQFSLNFSDDWQHISGKGNLIYKNIPITVRNIDLKNQPKPASYHIVFNGSAQDLQVDLKGDYFLNSSDKLFKAKLTMSGNQLTTLSNLSGVKLPAIGDYHLQTVLSILPQRWEFDDINLNIFQGKILANLVILLNELNHYQLNLTANEVNGGELLKSLELTDNISDGILTAQLSLSSRGNNLSTITSTLNGDSQFNLSKATYHIDERSGVKGDFLSLLAGNKLSKEVDLRCMTNVMRLQKGVSKNGLTLLDTPGATVVSSGVINFNNGALSLRLNPKGKGISLANLAIPLYIKGSLRNPVYIPDPVTLTKSTISNALNIATLGLFSNKSDPCAVKPTELKKIAVDLPDPDIKPSTEADSLTDKVKNTTTKAWDNTKSFFKDATEKVF